jgi:hypothetical protein
MRSILTVLLAGTACLLLAGCQANDEVIPETMFRSLLKLVPTDPADNSSFGLSVAVNGAYALVGAPGVDGNGTNSGAAYLFLQSQGGLDGWGQIKKLVASDADAEDVFGVSVAISGDYALVGAEGEGGSGSKRGAAYLFYRNQGGADNWGEIKKIVASDAANDDMLGYSVAIDGDYLVVGADREDGAGTNRGAAYLFYRNQGSADNWGQLKKLAASDAHNDDFFGFDVKVDGDFVLSGALYSGGGGTERGQVYLFSKNEGGTDNWGEAQILRASDGANKDWFGSSIALDGFYLLAGATLEDGAGTNRGAVYVFRKI